MGGNVLTESSRARWPWWRGGSRPRPEVGEELPRWGTSSRGGRVRMEGRAGAGKLPRDLLREIPRRTRRRPGLGRAAAGSLGRRGARPEAAGWWGGAGEVTAAAARGRWGSGEMGLVGLGPARPAPLVDLGFRTLAEGGNFSRGLPSAKVFYNFFLFSFSFLLLI